MIETRTARTPLEIARDRLGQAQSAIAKVLPVANKHGQYDMAADLTKMMVALSTHGKVLSDLLYKDRKPTPLDAPKPMVQEPLAGAVVVLQPNQTVAPDGTVETRRLLDDEPLESALPVVAHIGDDGVLRAGSYRTEV